MLLKPVKSPVMRVKPHLTLSKDNRMMISFTHEDFAHVTPATTLQALLAKYNLSILAAPVAVPSAAYSAEWDWHNRVDLTPDLVQEFIDGCAPKTVVGLKVFAEHGPRIHADLLKAAGIENPGHFQGTTTKRTRTVTKNAQAYLLAFDNWNSEANGGPGGTGHYAVTETTYQTLRSYFGLN